MVHLEGYFQRIFVHLAVYIDTFLSLQLKDKIQIELKPNFNEQQKQKSALHLNIYTY